MYPILFPIKRGDFGHTTPSVFRIAELFWAHVVKNEGCLEWKGEMHTKGYGRLVLEVKRLKTGKDRRVKFRAHRISWLLHKGEIPVGNHVLHNCDNRKCVRLEHLFLGDDKSNYDDAIAKGRRAHKGGCFAAGPNLVD